MMKCIKFKYGLKLELTRTVKILKIYDFPILVHKCRFLHDIENHYNNKSRDFRPWINKERHIRK